MKMQKVLSHNAEKELEFDDYISETCAMCGIELIMVEDIMVDGNDQYICKDCKEYHHVNALACADINYGDSKC